MLEKRLLDKFRTKNYARQTIESISGSLRSFLRYAEQQGWCQKDLSRSIKAPRIYRYESLPSTPDWHIVKRLLSDSNMTSPREIRDHAILMLLSVYGIRSGEVSRLQLSDIDWRNETIQFTRSKSEKLQVFPLVKAVGDAILIYLKRVRHNSSRSKEIFLCMRAPYQPVTVSVLYSTVAPKLKAMNIQLKHYGPHALRHACATHLINNDVSLKEIANHLGHQHLDTTRLYAKVNLSKLRKVTEFKLGELL